MRLSAAHSRLRASGLDALHFTTPRFDALSSLSNGEWRQLIDFCHRTQLAIPFALRCRESFAGVGCGTFRSGPREQRGTLAADEARVSPGKPRVRSRGTRVRYAQGLHSRSRLRGRSALSRAVRSGFAIPARPACERRSTSLSGLVTNLWAAGIGIRWITCPR